MNLVSTVVGMAITGTAIPMVAQMSIQPAIAQKRQLNFSVAETAAVTYATKAELDRTLPDIPDECKREEEDGVYTIQCQHGEGNFEMTAKRAFRLPEVSSRPSFNYASTPNRYSGHQCRDHDNWGLNTQAYNPNNDTWKGASCIPQPLWDYDKYIASNPDHWMYNINGYNGWGPHPNY